MAGLNAYGELEVPAHDPGRPWPTLGPQVCGWIESNLVFGPGVKLGEPAELDGDTRHLICRAYEVWPQGTPLAGRRRFRRAGISLRKGSAKTEKGAWICAAELHPDAPVRCDGFDARGVPVGVGVLDPYIPMIATTEDQSEELGFAGLLKILERCDIGQDFDLGLERIMRGDGAGKCEAVAGSPNARDGARTTFEWADESHRLVSARHKDAVQVMLANLPKRIDAWMLETTTAPEPGENSVAEDTWRYAEEVDEGKRRDSTLFFFHRQAKDGYDLAEEDQVRTAIAEASGEDIGAWSNTEGILEAWRDPQTDLHYWERVWLNRKVQSSAQVFNMVLVGEQATKREKRLPPRRTDIALGFDGSRSQDTTGIIGTEIESGYQFLVAVWERPALEEEWEVPADEVDQAMEDAFEFWRVRKAYCDPYYWEPQVDAWFGKWPKEIARFHTNQYRKMGFTLAGYVAAWNAREVTHDGSEVFLRHLANARKIKMGFEDDQGEKVYIMGKERKNSPMKIDLAMAGTLSWTARGDAIAGGALRKAGSKPGRTTVKFY
ncbi:MAG TPA: terminase [Chloroflexota bacterium]|nr:terminase [Chloroflexota bacterium]